MPTASDMVRLGNMLTSAHRQRNAAIADLRVEVREHAAETAQFLRRLHGQTRTRKRDMRRHAAETGRFMGQLHDTTRVRKRDVRRHAAGTASFVRYMHGVTRERKHEVAQLLNEVQQFMAGLAAITKGGRNEWRRQQGAIEAARKTGTGTIRRASRQGGDVGGPMLAYIAQHPGTRLSEIEGALRINRIKAARTVRALLDEGKIKRDEETRKYFPA
jgi:hypothetical protein